MWNAFNNVNPKKSKGPDNICGKVVKTCSNEFPYIFSYIYNLSFKNHYIPKIWKLSEVIPVPKKPNFSVMNDLRPITLTSIITKCF